MNEEAIAVACAVVQIPVSCDEGAGERHHKLDTAEIIFNLSEMQLTSIISDRICG